MRVNPRRPALRIALHCSTRAARRAGLSVARIVAVEGDALLLAGADPVDGTSVLDVKPYLPFCDGVPAAAAPPWVRPGSRTWHAGGAIGHRAEGG